MTCLRATALAAMLGVAATFAHAGESESSRARTDRIDTEHLFAFMVGTDTGEVGEKELESEVVGRFGKRPGSYRALFPSLEFEWVPIENLRLSATGTAASHAIANIAGLEDRQQWAFEALSFDVRYRLIDRARSGFGLALDVEPHWGHVDETGGEPVDRYGADLSLLFDRELVPNRIVAALNLIYQPEVSRLHATGVWSREATAGIAAGLMARVAPGVLIGGEARFLRKYEGLALDHFAGQALFVGPTLYARLTDRVWMIAGWSAQAAGRAAGGAGALDLTNFERYHAKIQFGLEFGS